MQHRKGPPHIHPTAPIDEARPKAVQTSIVVGRPADFAPTRGRGRAPFERPTYSPHPHSDRRRRAAADRWRRPTARHITHLVRTLLFAPEFFLFFRRFFRIFRPPAAGAPPRPPEDRRGRRSTVGGARPAGVAESHPHSHLNSRPFPTFPTTGRRSTAGGPPPAAAARWWCSSHGGGRVLAAFPSHPLEFPCRRGATAGPGARWCPATLPWTLPPYSSLKTFFLILATRH